MNKQASVLVIFGKELPSELLSLKRTVNTVLAKEELRHSVESSGFEFISIESFIEPGSIYDASAFAEELSRITLPDGSSIAKSFIYKGYELWWMHYNNLFLYFCLPFTQYKKLLEYLKDFQDIYFFQPPYLSLFSCYLSAYECNLNTLRDPNLKSPSVLPFGVLIQIFITLICIPILMIYRRKIMLFIGDKFEKSKDYDFRMKFIYEELRNRNLQFIEFVRSLESWQTIIKHAIRRKRPVIYSEAVAFVGRFISIISGGNRRAKQKFGDHLIDTQKDPSRRFKIKIATQYMLGVYDDVWAIRIMKLILQITGVKVAFIAAALERNYHAVFGCKLNNIPTRGILHGVSSYYYNVYDFLPAFNGEKMISVDKYGLWSEWWKEYYMEYSKAYRPEQLDVSGPMRPLAEDMLFSREKSEKKNGPIKVLFVSGQLSEPKEIIPYLTALLDVKDFSIYLTFRHYRDNFEKRLREVNPQIIKKFDSEKILRGDINEAISKCDIIVGSNSTAVLEALLQLKPLVFFNTAKWGDYFGARNFGLPYKFFAENSIELIKHIRQNVDIQDDILKELQKRFFGDPCQNGSKWVVDELEKILKIS